MAARHLAADSVESHWRLTNTNSCLRNKSRPSGQEIPPHVCSSQPPLDPTLGQINPFHNVQQHNPFKQYPPIHARSSKQSLSFGFRTKILLRISHLSNARLNSILPSMLDLPNSLFPSASAPKSWYVFLTFPTRAIRPTHHTLNLSILILFGHEYKFRSS